jgi:hypothetical protein
MGVLAWLERRIFTGDVVKDYGVVSEKSFALGRMRTSLLLCRRSGALQIVVRTAGRAAMGASVQYAVIDATPDVLTRLEQMIGDVRAETRAASRRS